MEYIKFLADGMILNNLILVTFVGIFIYAFWKENRNQESPIAWTDLLIDKKTNKLSLSKFGQFWGVFLSSWVVMYLTQKAESYGYLVPIFAIWLTFLAGSHAYDKYLKASSKDVEIGGKE